MRTRPSSVDAGRYVGYVALPSLLACLTLVLALRPSGEIISVESARRGSGFTTNATGWYVNSTDWLNVTLTQGVKICLSRNDGMIHWYWPTNPLEDRRVWKWSAIRVETWGYNDGQGFDLSIDPKIAITESSDKTWILVNETWTTEASHKTTVELYMVFHRDVPWFYCYAKQTYMVEPNSTILTDWYRVGIQPQICVFLNGSDFVYTPSAFNESKIKTGEIMPVTYQWMERFKKFPWIAMYDRDDSAVVGLVVLSVYPPTYDLMYAAPGGNEEAQITFMSAGTGGISECWYFPKDFYWYTQFVVYPCVDDAPPYYDKIDDLAMSLYDSSFTSTNFDSSFASASHTPVSFSWPPEKAQPSILNKIGCLGGFLGAGVVFWNGTTPRHRYSGFPNNYMLNFDQQYYDIGSDAGHVSGSDGWNSTIAGTDSRYGYHVQCWKRQTFTYPAYEFDVELEHKWEAWNDSDKFLWTTTIEMKKDSNLSDACFWLNKGDGEVIQLNSTTWEVYNVTCWGDEPSITLMFKNSTVQYSKGRWTCYLVKNKSQKEYHAGDKFEISFYLWLHYGHITEASQVTAIHTIQPVHIAPFHTHFHGGMDNQNATGDFAFWTSATFVDARVTHSQGRGELTVIEDGSGMGTVKIDCADYGEPERVQVNGENTVFQYDNSTRVLTVNIDFSRSKKGVGTIVVDIPDTTSPRTQIVIGSPSYSRGGDTYVGSNTSYALNSIDKGFGTAYTSFKIDNEPWVNYSRPFNLTGHEEGRHVIQYFAVDRTDNIEATKTTAVILDNSPPTTICDPPGGKHSGPMTVNLTSMDSAAGVKETYYRRSSEEEWKKFAEPFTVTGEGDHEIHYYSVDNLGNVESIKSTSYTIEKELPWTETIVAAAVIGAAGAFGVSIRRMKRRKNARYVHSEGHWKERRLGQWIN